MESPGPSHGNDEVKNLRVRIDVIIKHLNANFAPSRELSLVRTKLQEAKMWAGQELGRLGNSLPAEFRDEAPAALVPGPTQIPVTEPQAADSAAPAHIVADQPDPVNPANVPEVTVEPQPEVNQPQ